MRGWRISLAGIGVSALALLSLATGATGAAGSTPATPASRVPPMASEWASGVAAHGTPRAQNLGATPVGACQTMIGSALPSPNGIVSWNDESGRTIDTEGAADVVCLHARNIGTVAVYGWAGARMETFHVTFYANDPTDGSNEPDDNSVICDYPSLTGHAGGKFPHAVKTVLTLRPACTLPAGESWVAIQSVDPKKPWFWEMQVAQAGIAAPDWDDAYDNYGTGCTTFDNDRYLVDCMGFDYGDWMLHLGGARHG